MIADSLRRLVLTTPVGFEDYEVWPLSITATRSQRQGFDDFARAFRAVRRRIA